MDIMFAGVDIWVINFFEFLLHTARNKTQDEAHEPECPHVCPWNLECKVCSVKYGVNSVDCQVWSVKCGVEVWNVKCAMWRVKCGVLSVEYGVLSGECKAWSVKIGVGSVKSKV